MGFTKVLGTGIDAGHVGIKTTGGIVGTGFTMLNFVGAGNTFAVNGKTIDISIAGGGGAGDAIIRENFIVTANTQSAFTLTNDYSLGFIDVYLNGIKLPEGDFTEQPPNQVTLVSAASKGDTVEFAAWRNKVSNTTIHSEVQQLKVTGIGSFAKTAGTVHDETRLTSLDFVFETPTTKTITTDITLSATSGSIMYTKAQNIEIANSKFLIISDGDSLVIDSLQLG